MLRIFLLLFVVLVCVTKCLNASSVQEDEQCDKLVKSVPKHKCFHHPSCPTETCKCQLIHPNCKKAVYCCNITNYGDLTEQLACSGSTKLVILHIKNAVLDKVNVSEPRWKMLEHMSIVEGKINEIVDEFKLHAAITCLNVSRNGITKIQNRSLVKLSKLQVLDLSHNNLTEIPNLKQNNNDKKILLDILDNKQMLCTQVLEAIKKKIAFENNNKTTCLSSKTFNWFNTTEEVPLLEVERFHYVDNHTKQCPENCTCKPYRMVIVAGSPPTFTIRVNCSGLGLTALPKKLPTNTSSLDVTNNNVTSLQPIADDPSYDTVRELYADNNQITSILPLEGSKFLNNFVGMSLRNNKINELPTYFLSNILDRNAKSRVNLGENRVKCDCQTAKELKSWLLSKRQEIPDNGEIYCENINNQKVIFLDVKTVCQSDQDWSDYIYYIITAEVLLLVLLIAKVSYDYWVFKTAGYLPWPASKMPKLPCDWLCE